MAQTYEEPDATEAGTLGTLAATSGRLDLAPGTALGRYVILERLGAGGMGVVFAAYDPELDRRVAIKLLRAEGRDGGARMIREAQAMAKVEHPNVVTVHDVGEVDGRVFIAMEFVDGGTLRQWLQDESRSPTKVLEVLLAAGEGLFAAHLAGLVHRDFKPDNVLMSRDGRVRVTDFGLARAERAHGSESAGSDAASVPVAPRHDALSTPLTREGAVMGTPRYMAPEQHLGASTDARTDQFAYCVTAWEALAGRHPFEAESLVALTMAVVDGDLGPGTTIPVALRRVMQRGLSARPDDRYPSMRELLADLARDPMQTRRRWITAGVALTIVAGGVGAQQWMEARRIDRCRREADAIAGDYDASRAAALERVVTAQPGSYAELAARRMRSKLDAYAAAWTEARDAWCRDTDEAEAARLAARADDCFEDARVRLVEHLAVFEEIDSIIDVHAALEATVSFPDPSLCGSPRHLAARAEPPPGNGSRGDVLRRDLARAEALIVVGRRDEAVSAVDEALAVAEEIGSDAMAARAQRERGELAQARGQYPAAESTYVTGYELALASGEDRLAGEIATDLTWLMVASVGDVSEAQLWARLGRASLRRVGAEDSVPGALHDVALARVETESGRLDAAAEALQRARSVLARELGEGSLEYIEVIDALASLAVERGDWDGAERHHEEALRRRKALLGPDHTRVGDTLQSMGAMFEVRKSYDRAIDVYARALPIFEAVGDDWRVAAIHNNLGVIMLATGRLDEAEGHYLDAQAGWEASLGPDAAVLAHPAWGLSGVALARGDARAAIAHAERCVRLRRAAGASPGELAEADVALARALWAEGTRRDEARRLAAEAREVFVADGERRRADLAELDAWLASSSADAVADPE